jgi:hypothetical protein
MEQMSLRFVRVWFPALVVAAGIVLLVVGMSSTAIGAGIVLVGAGLLIALFNFVFRMGLESNLDREREESARRFLDRTGRWPTREERSRLSRG